MSPDPNRKLLPGREPIAASGSIDHQPADHTTSDKWIGLVFK